MLTDTDEFKLKTRKIFWGVCLLHACLWIVIPLLFPGSVPQDTVEGIAWGYQWQWGYDKHPPLAAWLSAGATLLGGSTGWPVYVLAQLAIILSFWCVWRLAKEFFSPIYALISVLLLEGIIYYNLLSPKFNPGTLMTPVWAVCILLTYFALKKQKLWLWLLLGFAIAANIYTKYQAPFIILPLMSLLLISPEGRESFKKPGLYCSIIFCIILLIPHIQWSIKHHFEALTYIFDRTNTSTLFFYRAHEAVLNIGTTLKIVNHFWLPFILMLSQLGAMAGLFLMLLPFYKVKRIKLDLKSFEQRFIYVVGLGPMVLTLSYAIVTGDFLNATWCTPYFSLFGILALLILRPAITPQSWRYFFRLCLAIIIIIPVARYSSLTLLPYINHKAESHEYIPGAVIAENLTSEWHARYHRPLKYVAGSHYLVVYITAYSPDKPTPYLDWDMSQNAWINEADLKKNGAIFVWYIDANQGAKLSLAIKKRFPHAIQMSSQSYKKLTGANVQPLAIGVAFLPPSDFTNTE